MLISGFFENEVATAFHKSGKYQVPIFTESIHEP